MSLDALRLATAGTAFCGTLLLAFLSFRYFEAPFLGLKHFFAEPSAAPVGDRRPIRGLALDAS